MNQQKLIGLLINVTYFESFGIEHIPKEIRTFTVNKNVITNIYRVQIFDSIMCGYFYTGFVDFMLKGKSVLGLQIYFLLVNTKIMTK